MAQANPLKTPIADMGWFARMNDLYLFEKQIKMSTEIRKYLTNIFYEMTALSPNDYRTYEHMRSLAADKLGIQVLPSHLPCKQMEQGIDIMLLLRETETYVSNFHYNLHTQTFVERTHEAKQIRTIGVNQMLYSIRTHGVGILNNVMNQLYKFIRKQINNFCKNFLMDESIKNSLFREARIFARDKEKLNGQFSYTRAAELAKNIKNLVEGVDYLQTIRTRIT